MSTYELNDALVRRVVGGRTTADDQEDLFRLLEEQLPVPAPTLPHAVVRTDQGVFTLGHPGNGLCWLRSPENTIDGPDWLSTEDVGAIRVVLFGGVSLGD